ncbi:MAG: hypothetical protein LBH26_03940 [Treponema sp.]|jgi:hypothetical protein|nr:hypothetical protein [Treponema sp.]
MDYLISFLLSNLIPIVIVVSIVLRIYKGMKNAADSRRGKTAAMPVQSMAEQDEDEDETAGEGYLEDDIRHRFYLAESAPPRQKAPPAPSLAPLPELKPLDNALPAEPLPVPQQVPASPAAPAPVPAFFHRIAALRPMQQALVLSEILGPPKGAEP